MRPGLDLNRSHFHRDLGDIQVYGSWYTDDDGETEPCLALLPTARVGKRTTPCCVTLSSAYLYHYPESGHRHLLRTAREFLPKLGFEDSMMMCHKVADAIHSHLLDLIQMPEYFGEAYVAADVEILDPQTGRRYSREVIDHE